MIRGIIIVIIILAILGFAVEVGFWSFILGVFGIVSGIFGIYSLLDSHIIKGIVFFVVMIVLILFAKDISEN